MTQYYIQLCPTPLLSRRFFPLQIHHLFILVKNVYFMRCSWCLLQELPCSVAHRLSSWPLYIATACHTLRCDKLTQLGSGADGLPSCDLCSCLAALKDDHFLWFSRLFALSPHKVQEPQTHSRGQLKLHWLTDIIWTVSFSKTKQRQVNYL